MPAEQRIEVSLTEAPQFTRLVELLHDVEIHAVAFSDELLLDLATECREDLLRMRIENA